MCTFSRAAVTAVQLTVILSPDILFILTNGCCAVQPLSRVLQVWPEQKKTNPTTQKTTGTISGHTASSQQGLRIYDSIREISYHFTMYQLEWVGQVQKLNQDLRQKTALRVEVQTSRFLFYAWPNHPVSKWLKTNTSTNRGAGGATKYHGKCGKYAALMSTENKQIPVTLNLFDEM